MPAPKLSRMEYQIMEALWEKGEPSLREIQESFPAKQRPAYTTIQTMVYRMEAKGIVTASTRAATVIALRTDVRGILAALTRKPTLKIA